MITATFDTSGLDGELLMESAELGHEYLIRVRVIEVREEAIEVTAIGDTEPRIASGLRSARLLPLAVRASTKENT